MLEEVVEGLSVIVWQNREFSETALGRRKPRWCFKFIERVCGAHLATLCPKRILSADIMP